MAIKQDIPNPVTAISNRTVRMILNAPLGMDGSIELYRENIPLDAAGERVGSIVQSGMPIMRTQAQFIAEPDVPVTREDGTQSTVKTEDIYLALQYLGDKWTQEEIDKKPNPIAQPAPPPPIIHI